MSCDSLISGWQYVHPKLNFGNFSAEVVSGWPADPRFFWGGGGGGGRGRGLKLPLTLFSTFN